MVASAKVSDEETALEPVAVCVVETESSAVVERACVDSRLLDIEPSVVETDEGRHGPRPDLFFFLSINRWRCRLIL